MILADFLIADKGGYYCRYGDFYLDPMQPVRSAVISHGHGDHASPGHEECHCTAPTASFMELRFARIHMPVVYRRSYHESFRVGDVEVSFVPAGHILGSAQVLMVYQGVRYLYTGDYKQQSDDTCEALEVVSADVLITECTFADPAISHPDPVEEIKKLRGVSGNIMLGAYSLGKAQRLSALINLYCPDKTLLVHHGIIPIHRIYESYGISLGPYQLYNRKAMKSSTGSGNIYLVPPMTFRSYLRAKDVVKVFASGWERLQKNNHLDLYISDHVDWKEILAYIDQVAPKEIWTIHGNGQHLREYFGGLIPVRTIR